MPAFTDIAIIYNPNSTGRAEDRARQLQQELKTALLRIPVSLLPTERAGHAVELAYDFAQKHKRPLIISASGDGGYHEVINGALRAQAKGARPICAVLPSGNANDHARTMHDRSLAELIVAEKVTSLEILSIRITAADGTEASRYAHSYIGLGLTPTVAVELNKHTLNSLKEAWIVTKTFWGLRPVRIKDERGVHKLDSLICSIIPEMAKVLTITDQAHPRDGLFEITAFEHNRKLKLLLRLIRGVVKNLGAERRASEYSFTVLESVPIQLDGEVMELEGNTTVTIAAQQGLLQTIASV
ncbi:MAG TPA: diacylglycerol kinase family protein [Candidatus Limnocylindrales bacterium]|nr:diacylglycerol kinase family protein [Candidatus Limnocylindrales bacterium]